MSTWNQVNTRKIALLQQWGFDITTVLETADGGGFNVVGEAPGREGFKRSIRISSDEISSTRFEPTDDEKADQWDAAVTSDFKESMGMAVTAPRYLQNQEDYSS